MKRLLLSIILFITWSFLANAQRGYYDASYTRYEADLGKVSGGTTQASTYDQSILQSEASDQTCVLLNGGSQSVTWTVTQSGDGLVVRYSLPDTQSGELDVYVDNAWAGTMTLTTYYSWEYLMTDGNPNNVSVTNPNPKMRFDEVRMHLPNVAQAGSSIRLERKSGNVYLDFMELELVPAAVSSDPGDLVYSGNGSGLQTLIDQNGGNTIYLPAGYYEVDRELFFGVNGTKLKGAGSWYTQIHFTNGNAIQGGLRSNAYDVSFEGLFLTTVRNSRSNSYKGINGVFTQGSVLEDLWVEHFEAGAWIGQYNTGPAFSDGFTMRHCRFRNNYADGVNLTKGSRNCVVTHCHFRNNGDDAMAVWSRSGNEECSNNEFSYSTIENNWRAAGVAIYGGLSNEAHHIIIKDNLEAGVRLNNIFPDSYFNSSGMHSFYEITIIKGGTNNDLFNDRIGAIDLMCTDGNGGRVRNVEFDNIDVIDSKNDAVNFQHWSGIGFDNIDFSNITIDGTGLEFPLNNIESSSDLRGHAIRWRGNPGGYGTYCNMSYTNRGGNAVTWEDGGEIGSFSWSSATGCESANVGLTSPLNGATFYSCQGEVQMQATASSATGTISKVEFFVDGQKVGEDLSQPYSFTATGLAIGSHMLSVMATTSPSGNTSLSEDIEIEVLNMVTEATVPIAIDGIIDAEWANHPSQDISYPLAGSQIDGPADLSASYRVASDATYFYVLVEVTDDVLIQDSPANTNWMDDKVEIYIDYGNDKGGTYGNDDHFYGFVHNVNTFYVGPGYAGGGSFSQSITGSGYNLEMRIPWSSLGGIPQYGDELGLEIMVGDDDDGGDRDAKLVLSDVTDMSWNNPSLFSTIGLLPTIRLTEGICKGESATMPDGTILGNVQQTTSHISNFTSVLGCDSVIETTVDVFEINKSVIEGVNLLLSSNTVAQYQWLDCDDMGAIQGSTTRNFTVPAPGNYAVELTEEGCVDTSACVDVVFVGLEQQLGSSHVNVWPNPTAGEVHIELDENIESVEVYTMYGKLLSAFEPDQVQMAPFPAGMYVLKLRTVQGSYFAVKVDKL